MIAKSPWCTELLKLETGTKYLGKMEAGRISEWKGVQGTSGSRPAVDVYCSNMAAQRAVSPSYYQPIY